MPQGQPEFPRLPRVHAELKPQSFIPAAGQTQRPDPGVTRRHSDRHQHGAASRRRGRRGLGSGQRGVEGIGGRGRGGGGEGRGGRTRGRLRSSGALRHSTVTADNFAFHRRFSSYRCYCAVITLLSSTRTHTHTRRSRHLNSFHTNRKRGESIRFHFSSGSNLVTGFMCF